MQYLLNEKSTEMYWSNAILIINWLQRKSFFSLIKLPQTAAENQYSLVDQVHLWAHLSLCPLEAPLAPEGPVAPEAQVVLLALDLPVWQNNTF